MWDDSALQSRQLRRDELNEMPTCMLHRIIPLLSDIYGYRDDDLECHGHRSARELERATAKSESGTACISNIRGL